MDFYLYVSYNIDKGGEKMINIGRNIKTARKSKGYSQIELGEKIGVSDKTISSWENNRNEPSIVDIQKLADALGTRKSVLIDGLDIVSEPEPYHTSVKVYGKIAAGQPIEAIEEVIDEIVCPYTKFNSENLFALQVCGDSMNKIIQDGDYAIINKQPTVNDGEIAAVLIDGSDATLKKFYRLPDKIALYPLSTNSIHKPIEITEADNIEVNILGKFICGVTPLQEN